MGAEMTLQDIIKEINEKWIAPDGTMCGRAIGPNWHYPYSPNWPPTCEIDNGYVNRSRINTFLRNIRKITYVPLMSPIVPYDSDGFLLRNCGRIDEPMTIDDFLSLSNVFYNTELRFAIYRYDNIGLILSVARKRGKVFLTRALNNWLNFGYVKIIIDEKGSIFRKLYCLAGLYLARFEDPVKNGSNASLLLDDKYQLLRARSSDSIWHKWALSLAQTAHDKVAQKKSWKDIFQEYYTPDHPIHRILDLL